VGGPFCIKEATTPRRPKVLPDEQPKDKPAASLRPDRNTPYRKADPTRAGADLQAFREKYGRAEQITDASRLPKWLLYAVVLHEHVGLNWSDAMRELFTEKQAARKRQMLDHYRKCPAYKELLATVKAWDRDQVRAEAVELVAAHAMQINVTNLRVLQLAKDTNNVAELGKQSRWLAENFGMTIPKKSEQAPTAIHITLNNATISGEIPMGESDSHKILPAEIVTDE
jgi:hypothetical protein